MGQTSRRRIDLLSNVLYKERIGSEALTPGYCVTINTSGQLALHDQDGGPGPVRLVLPNDLEGDGVTDAYDVSDTVKFATFAPGDEVLVRVKDGENIAIGDYLTHDGNGKFREVVTDSSGQVVEDTVVLQALEACDMSSSSGVDDDGYCVCEVIQ
jgi:hypothetical protein